MSSSSDIDIKVGFWIRGVPYIWKRLENGEGDPTNWKDWQRIYIFLEGVDRIPSNLLPEECSDDVRQYFNYISQDQFHYERYISRDFDYYRSVIRIDGKDIDQENIPVKLVFNYKGKKLLDHIVSKVTLAQPRIPEGESTLSDYHKDWHIWASVWYIDQIMGKDKRVCFLINPDSTHIGIELVHTSKKLSFGPPMKKALNRCLNRNFTRFIYVPLYEKGRADGSHVYLLLIDVEQRVIYLFDPVGIEIRWKGFEQELLEYLGLDWTWNVKILDWCPVSKGIQALQDQECIFSEGDPGGFCITWVLWVVETLINNSDKHFKEVLKTAYTQMKEETPSFTRFIRRYSKSIIDYQRNSPKKNEEYIRHNLKKYAEYLEGS
jgi:hypothetical protein